MSAASPIRRRWSAEGRRLWEADPALRARIPNLEALVSITPAALAREVGADKADAVIAYLRADPAALTRAGGSQSLAVAHELLRQSLAAYRRGDRDEAGELALAAYLDGFEPVEAMLGARDGGLVAEVEREMGGLRAAIGRGAPAGDVAARVERLDALFGRAEAALAPEAGSGASTFLGAFAILLREGLEALLIVVAMIGFLRKAERRDMLKYVHGGWLVALVAGVAHLVGGEPPHHHLRRRPRADRRVRLAARRRDPAVRRHLDARQGAGRRLAGLCPRQARTRR